MKPVGLIFALLLCASLPSGGLAAGSGFDVVDWFQHWNLSLSMIDGNPHVQGPSHAGSFSFTDDFGDTYTFSMTQLAVDEVPTSLLHGTLRIPLYYTDTFSFGLQGNLKGLGADVFPDGSFWARSGGVYLEQRVWRLAAHGYLGFGNYSVSGPIGEVAPSFPGDPGGQIKGEWFDVGDPVTIYGGSNLTPVWGGGVRFSFLPAVYAEVAFHSWGAATVEFDHYTLTSPGNHTQFEIVVPPAALPKPVEVGEHTMITIGIGVGY